MSEVDLAAKRLSAAAVRLEKAPKFRGSISIKRKLDMVENDLRALRENLRVDIARSS